MLDKSVRSPSSGEDSVSAPEAIMSDPKHRTTPEADHPPSFPKFFNNLIQATTIPATVSVSKRNTPQIEQNSDGGASSSASTLSTSSGRRSKCRNSRHSSDEIIGEEDSDDDLSDNKSNGEDIRVQPSIFELNHDQSAKTCSNEKHFGYENDMDRNKQRNGVIMSSDVDSAFEDQPLVGRGSKSKKRIKQRKSTRGSTKTNKSMKLVIKPSSQSPSSHKVTMEERFPFLPYDEYKYCPELDNHQYFEDRPCEIALFNLEVSPVQDSPLGMEMEEVAVSEMMFNNYSILELDTRESKSQGVSAQEQIQSRNRNRSGPEVIVVEHENSFFANGHEELKDILDVDPHHSEEAELLFLSHLEADSKKVHEINPRVVIRTTTAEAANMDMDIGNPNGNDVCPQQPNHKNSGNDYVEIKTDEGVEYDVEWIPPDGGWGWMVLLGSIIVNILIPGTVKSFGVLFIEFIEVFEATPAAASWIPALSYWLYSSTGPFATALAIKYSHRSVTIAGGILAAAGLMLSYFATSIEYLYISYGLIGGLGAGLAYPIGVIMVGQYFRRRVGLANGLCTSGSALGSVLMPPLLRFLLFHYDYRGAILILGAILLNVCVAAMFYDPVEKHLKKVLTPKVIPIPPVVANGVILSKGRSPATSNVDIRKQGSSPFVREMAMSMPIAIPLPNLNERDVRDRRGSGSIKKATFQIGNETPTGDSWSLRSNDGPSPLANRLLKEDPGSPKMYHNSNLRTRPFPCSLESTSEMESLFNTHLNTCSGGAISMSTHASNAASRSKLNLTAIPEDDDLDQITSECGSRNGNLDWGYYRNLTPAKQRLMRLSTGAGNTVVSSSSQPHNMNRNNSIGKMGTGLPRTMSVASNVSNSSFHYVSTIHHGSLLMTMQYDKSMPDFASTLTLKSVRQSCWSCWFDFSKRLLRKCGVCPTWTAATDSQTRTIKKRSESWKRFIDLSLLKDGLFIIILISSATTAIGYTNFIILLPSYALALGLDKSDASLLLSIVAAADFVGRIGGAALSDLLVKQRKWFYILGLLGSGIALSLLPLTKSYWPLVSFCVAFGLTSGIYIGVTAIILADLLGIDKLGSSYGITLFLNGIVQLAGPPVCGILLEYFNSYVPILVGLGITLIFGAAVWIFTPFIDRHRTLNAEAEEYIIEANGINPEEKQLQHLVVRRLKEAEAV